MREFYFQGGEFYTKEQVLVEFPAATPFELRERGFLSVPMSLVPVGLWTPEEIAEEDRKIAKAARTVAVENITVTTQAGNTFDGDETSQTRMARAIVALQATGTPSTVWVLADNTAIQATVAELSEALALAGAAQAAIWVIE